MWTVKARGQPIFSFLSANKPSKTCRSITAWIAVTNESPNQQSSRSAHSDDAVTTGKLILEDLTKSLNAKEMSKKKLQDRAVDDLKEIATMYHYTSGKWFISPAVQDIDQVWEDVAKLTVAGELGSQSKVAPTLGSGESRGCICVYIDDFNDIALLRKSLEKLKSLNIKPVNFKLDLYAELGIYYKNEWGLKTGIYTPYSPEFQSSKSSPKNTPKNPSSPSSSVNALSSSTSSSLRIQQPDLNEIREKRLNFFGSSDSTITTEKHIPSPLKWTCGMCTLINEGSAAACCVCETKRE